jgi:hypothetical protein
MTPRFIIWGSFFTPETGGGSGIRTHDEVVLITVFKCFAVRTNRFISMTPSLKPSQYLANK